MTGDFMSSVFWSLGRHIELFLLLLVLHGLLHKIFHMPKKYIVGQCGVVPFKTDLGPSAWGAELHIPEQWVGSRCSGPAQQRPALLEGVPGAPVVGQP